LKGVLRKIHIAREAARSKKAYDLVVIDLRGLFPFSDFWLICSGTSSVQTQAIAEEIMEKMQEHSFRPLHVEGEDTGEWILLDYGDLIVHIFREAERSFYQLEKLWRKAPLVYSERENVDLLEDIRAL
jgi:ribosome-associated protein